MMFTECQWIGSGEGCNHTALPTTSYCQHHYPRIYAVGSALSRRKADQRLAGYIVKTESEPDPVEAED
jgi:hypothetical protein